MHLAAQQFVDGFVDVFAHNVPAGHLDSAQDAHGADVGAVDEAAAVHAAPDALDVIRVFAHHAALHHVAHHVFDHVGVVGQVVDLAQAFNAGVGHQLDEHKVAPAKAGWGVADHKGLDVGDFHGVSVCFVLSWRS